MPYKDPKNPKYIAYRKRYYLENKERFRCLKNEIQKKYRSTEKGKKCNERFKLKHPNKNKESCRNYYIKKQENKIKLVHEIKSILTDVNISYKDDLTFQAAVVCWSMIFGVASSQRYLAEKTGYPKNNVKMFLYNWEKSGLLERKIFNLDNPPEDIIQLTCIALVGTGTICAIQA